MGLPPSVHSVPHEGSIQRIAAVRIKEEPLSTSLPRVFDEVGCGHMIQFIERREVWQCP